MTPPARFGSILLCAAGLLALNGCGKPKNAEPVHNSNWYQAHPDEMRADEKKCAGDAATISRDACQNVYAAENALGVQEMTDAARRNSDAAHPPSKP